MSSDYRENSPLKSKEESRRIFLEAYNKFCDDNNISNLKMAELLGLSYSTIQDTCSNGNLNANFVLAFCLKYRTIDIETIYLKDTKEPEGRKSDDSNFTLFRHSYDCHSLDDNSFMGKFYGYCRNTQYQNMIDDFELLIHYNTYQEIQADMVLNSHNQKGEVTRKYLVGKPMHLEPDIIYIVCQSDRGDDMFILSYNYFKLNPANKLYCRYGAMITPCRGTNRYPQMQSFVILDKPVKPENMHLIEGFLRLSQDRIMVPANLIDKESGGLMAQEGSVKEFFENCREVNYNKEEFYCFSEKVLLAIGEANGVDYSITASALMTLKENSVNPKAVNFPDNKTYSKFLQSLTKDEAL